MPIVLYRIDERLIHGQVVIGWGHELRPDRFVLVDDELSGSDWEQDLYRLGAGEADVLFAGVSEARSRLDEWRSAPERTILLTRDIGTMRALAEDRALEGETVNLGGLHHGPGRVEVLTYLHVTDAERDLLREMAADGVTVSARDLPDASLVPLATLLRSSSRSRSAR